MEIVEVPSLLWMFVREEIGLGLIALIGVATLVSLIAVRQRGVGDA
jgi:hypothetical protein